MQQKYGDSSKKNVIHAKKEIVALYKEIVEGTIFDGWI